MVFVSGAHSYLSSRTDITELMTLYIDTGERTIRGTYENGIESVTALYSRLSFKHVSGIWLIQEWKQPHWPPVSYIVAADNVMRSLTEAPHSGGEMNG